MAFSATTEWEVRTTGSDSNGGGFDTAASGTDFSQQDSPQVTYTDLVIDVTFNTKITSSGHPFTSAHPGNIINVTGGTGFTVQRIQILSVVAGVATCDKAVGTVGSTGGTGNLGGGLLTIQKAADLIVDKNIIHIKAGTYTLTVGVSFPNTSGTGVTRFVVQGYDTVHGDTTGTRPLVTTATNSTNLFGFNGGGGVTRAFVKNINFSNTAGTRAFGVYAAGTYVCAMVEDCIFDGFTTAIIADGSSAGESIGFAAINCEFKNNSISCVETRYCGTHLHGCYIHDNTKDGIRCDLTNQSVSLSRCIFANNGRFAVYMPNGSGELAAYNCVFYNNGLTFSGNPFPALAVANSLGIGLIVNCILYGGGTGGGMGYFGPSGAASDRLEEVIGRNNAADVALFAAQKYSSYHDVLLTANPFNNAAGGDFTLNNTAGGGSVCRNAGIQWT